MLKDDHILLDSFERIYQVLYQEAELLKETKSVHTDRITEWAKEIRAYSRILEEVSLPARFILEHILELKHKAGQMAVEAENINQGFSSINEVSVEEFGVIKISTGNIQLSWRDGIYNYLLYPDKVELRTIDEKATIKLFFSHTFGSQEVQKFAAVTESPNLQYLHPVLRKYMD